jgi:hypothetical protein
LSITKTHFCFSRENFLPHKENDWLICVRANPPGMELILIQIRKGSTTVIYSSGAGFFLSSLMTDSCFLYLKMYVKVTHTSSGVLTWFKVILTYTKFSLLK